MANGWRRDRLPEVVRSMAARPRHEPLRGLVAELLREDFGAGFSELEHERYLLDNSGRVDVPSGATVIELKTDLRREERHVVARMPEDLADASRRSASGRASARSTTPEDLQAVNTADGRRAGPNELLLTAVWR